MVERSDCELLAAWRDGKEKAFEAIFHRYYARLVTFAFQIIENEAQAQEIASDALFLLYKKQRDFTNVNHLVSYLYVVVRNDCIDYLRSFKAYTIRCKVYTAETLDETDWVNIELDGVLLKRLYDSIENLPVKSRQVIQYLYIDQLSYQKVAELMETTVKNIENIRAYALKKLKRDLNNSLSPVLVAVLLTAFSHL